MDVYEEEVDEVLESDDEEALRGEKGKDAASKVAIKSAIEYVNRNITISSLD